MQKLSPTVALKVPTSLNLDYSSDGQTDHMDLQVCELKVAIESSSLRDLSTLAQQYPRGMIT